MLCFPVARLVFLAAVRHFVTFTAEFRPSTAANHAQLRVTTGFRVVCRQVKEVFVWRSFGIKVIDQSQLRAQNDKVVTGVLTTARRIAAQKHEDHTMQSCFRRVLLHQEHTRLSTSTAFQDLRRRQRLQRQPCRLSANFVGKIVTKCLPRFRSIDFEHVVNINNSTCRHFPGIEYINRNYICLNTE